MNFRGIVQEINRCYLNPRGIRMRILSGDNDHAIVAFDESLDQLNCINKEYADEMSERFKKIAKIRRMKGFPVIQSVDGMEIGRGIM